VFSFGWASDWTWAVPIILLTIILHVVGLALISTSLTRFSARKAQLYPMFFFMLVMGAAALLATLLHGLEAMVWAGAYTLLGALKDYHSAMLYSVNAMTTYGHESTTLTEKWSLLGSLEALDGMLLFGLTTAFLYGQLQRAWPVSTEA
jgi:hypothetical protein